MLGAVEQQETGNAAASVISQRQQVRKMSPSPASTTLITAGDGLLERRRYESESVCRSILGVTEDASWDQIDAAHTRLVADMTPGPKADHQRVTLALAMLDEVNLAFASLQRQAVA